LDNLETSMPTRFFLFVEVSILNRKILFLPCNISVILLYYRKFMFYSGDNNYEGSN